MFVLPVFFLYTELDSLTYLLSAVLMWQVGGKWSVGEADSNHTTPLSFSPIQLINTYKAMTMDGIRYLATCPFALFVLIKSSGSITFGSTDVLNVRLSHVPGDDAGDSRRLGILFAVMGVGCLLGPLVAERFVDMKRPRSMLGACVIAFALLSFGFAGIGLSSSFSSICLFTGVRGLASAIMWVNSTLLLQVRST